MRIERVARILLGVAALGLLLVNAGCNGTLSSALQSGSTSLPSVNVKAPGDWGRPLLAGGTVGAGMFPAKFTFDVNAAPNCTNDFVAFNTSLAGVSATAAASQTGTFTNGPTNGQTVTISSPGTSIVLTASGGSNTGLNFQNNASVTTVAANLAAAIVRNGAGVGVTATSAAGVVTVTASANGSEGNLITLAEGLSNFTWTAATLAGGVGTGNIVAFNKLYTTQGSVGGLCNQDGPSVYWSYFTGTGTAVTSVVLSGDGTKVAFVENVAGIATLRILKWKAGEGTGAGYPVAPTTTLTAGQNWTTNCPAGNSCMSSIAFSGAGATDTRSAPFYNYAVDTLYAGDDAGVVHKFTGVFTGTPAEVSVSWPIIVNAGATLTGPIFDGISGNIFVGDSTGRLSYIREVGSGVGTCVAGATPCLGTPNLAVGTAGAIVDAPVVDGTTGRVFAVNGTETSANHGTILQASTALAGAVSFKIGGNISPGSPLYSGAFDNTYFTSAMPNIAGHMYVCGKDAGFNNRPAIYQLSFAAATGILTGVGAPLTGLVSVSAPACSPVTEFNNPNGAGAGIATDWIFFSTGNNANTVNPIPFGSACRADVRGCVISIDVTGNPAWPPAAVNNTVSVPLNNNGATSGIVVDNTSTSAQASSFYFSLGANSTGAGPGVPSCKTTAGVGCAVKLTQSALD
jgi:hypothetical protein